MENDIIKLEIIKWYNEEKSKIINYMKDFDPKYERYKDYNKRLLVIDEILKTFS